MYSVEILFSLIRSMSKSEKRYFHLVSDMQKGAKSYLTLFDYLDSQRVFDDKLREGLREKFPGNTIEASRKHLYTVIMKSLRLYHADNDVEAKLMNLFHDSRILYDKGLLKASFDQLDKIRTISIKREKFTYYILAARQEMQYLARSQFSGINEYELLEKHKTITDLLNQENRIHQHAMLYEVLLLRYWQNGMARSEEEAVRLNDLLLEEYQLLNSPGPKPFELQQLHLYFQSIYFQMTGDATESLKVFYELDDLFQQNKNLWKDDPVYYFHLLDGILSDLRWMDRYADMNFFLARMKAIPSPGDLLAVMIQLRALEHELNRCVDQHKYEEASQLLEDHLQSVNRQLPLLPFQIHLRFMFTMVRVSVGIGDYSAALRTINTCLNRSSHSMNHAQSVIFQLINLQVNALTDNTDYLFYAIRSVERKLKEERKLHGVERLVMSLLKRFIAGKPLKGYDQQLATLEKNPYESQLMKELCLKEWLQRLKAKGSA